MNEILVAIYLLIGFQFGGRCFYWSRTIEKHWLDFIYPLIGLPLLWPLDVFISLFTKWGRDSLFKWDI